MFENHGFTFRRVDPHDDQLMEKIYRLRFEVYARQCKFIKEEDYPHQLEFDDYDKHSVHFAAIDPEGKVVATTRIILTDDEPSPLLKSCPALYKECNFRPGSIVEVSRFIICKKSTQKKEFGSRIRGAGARSLNRAAIVHGLFEAIYQEVKTRGITYWCALMEKSLQQLLRIYGFKTACLGQHVEMFGPVRPYLGSVSDFEHSRSKVFNFHNVSRHFSDVIISATPEENSSPDMN